MSYRKEDLPFADRLMIGALVALAVIVVVFWLAAVIVGSPTLAAVGGILAIPIPALGATVGVRADFR